MTLFILVILQLLCVVLVLSTPLNDRDKFTRTRRAEVGYRLNSKIRPIAYTVELTPYFKTGDDYEFSFNGVTHITVETETPDLSQITFHSNGLNYTQSDVKIVSGKNNEEISPADSASLVFDTDYDLVTIRLKSSLEINTNYTIKIEYRGSIRSELNGLYRSYYEQDGITQWLAATQLETVHARKMFPCFDEPAYKATFTLIIYREETHKQVLTNTKMQSSEIQSNGRIKETFYPSPVMPTYLVAVLISNFESGNYSTADGNEEFGVWSRPDVKGQLQYAFEFGQNALTALSEFTGVNYYKVSDIWKSDHVAIPDFRGAMENWGLVKYAETYLLYDPLQTNIIDKDEVARTITHELSHMWFGNLVTCHWWSDTWLNEGFATYLEYIVTDIVEFSLETENLFVVKPLQESMRLDQISSSPALTNGDVNTPAEISAHFGLITYWKGGSIIRMIEHWIGRDALSLGMKSYLETNKFGVGTPSDIYNAFQLGVDVYNSLLDCDDYDVESVMGTWITQAGYPALEVSVNSNTKYVSIKQKRFLVNGETSEEIYFIPITYTISNDFDFENTKPAFVLDSEKYIFELENFESDDFVIFNIQETGFYRVNYDIANWNKIARALKSESRKSIHRLNRAQIVDDVFAFMKADFLSVELAFEILSFLKFETDYYVWKPALYGLKNLRNNIKTTDGNLQLLNQLILNWINEAINSLGFEEKYTDDVSTMKNRMQILDIACLLGHEECLRRSSLLLDNFKNKGRSIPVNLRPFAYCYGLLQGDESDYHFLHSQYRWIDYPSEQQVIKSNHACTGVASRIRNYLDDAISESSSVRQKDLNSIIPNTLKIPSHAPIVFEYFKDNYATFETRYGSTTSVIDIIVNAFQSDEDLETVLHWLSNCVECSQEVLESAAISINSRKTSFIWSENKAEILSEVFSQYID